MPAAAAGRLTDQSAPRCAVPVPCLCRACAVPVSLPPCLLAPKTLPPSVPSVLAWQVSYVFLLAEALSSSSNSQAEQADRLKVLKVLRLVRLSKMLRLARIKRMLQKYRLRLTSTQTEIRT
eukprot:COSAG01_NODE_5659_length_4114_cov_12.053051_2_plen_121_part_00